MSNIEEWLARDIAAVTGGVVVTESDLRNAREAVDERIGSRRQRDRRRGVIAAAAAAVLVLIGGVAALQTLGGDEKTAPPANPGPTTSDPEAAAFLTGRAPTPDLIEGVWRVDNGTVLIRFSPPNVISFDDGGRLFHNPGVQGTYTIAGDVITVGVDGGPAGCGGQQIAMRASLPDPGAMHVVHTQPGTGNCTPEQNGRWVLEQVLPTSQTWAETGFSTERGWAPLADKSTLYGTWLAEGGGHLLEIDPGGSYYVADEPGGPIDRGQWSLRGSDLTLTSSAGSAACSEGDELVLGTVEQVDPGTTAMRSTVQQDTCGAAWATGVWILIPHEGTFSQP